jgi:hypothetical protein
VVKVGQTVLETLNLPLYRPASRRCGGRLQKKSFFESKAGSDPETGFLLTNINPA